MICKENYENVNMKAFYGVALLLLTKTLCNCLDNGRIFKKLNEETLKFNQIAAKLSWESSINPDNPDLSGQVANYQKQLIKWRQDACARLSKLHVDKESNDTEKRQAYLLCRGPNYTFQESREINYLTEELRSIYSDSKICIPTTKFIIKSNLTQIENAILNNLSTVKKFLDVENKDPASVAAKIAANGKLEKDKKDNVLCLNGDEDFEKLMVFSRNEQVLRWLWLVWRDKVGPPMKKLYRSLADIENRAARRNGYTDIGASWRQDLEIPNLRHFCRHLHSSIRHLYELLHGVTRFFLRRRYGDVVSKQGPIPAHLLGNLWSMNWEPLAELIVPKTLNMDESIRRSNWTIMHMMKRAEDMYESLGLPALGDKFWRHSVFSREDHQNMRCHATAADMFQPGDYRILYCSGTSAEDFYVQHHEMGHIQYYMAYEKQPAIYRQANMALHEAIGDAIMYGVNTPSHLHRLGLVNESVLYENSQSVELDSTPSNANTNTKSGDIFSPVNDDENFEFGKITKTEETELEEMFSADEILMLKTALNKIPQIPFSLVIEEFRWNYFEGSISDGDVNKHFWELALELQGIAPPGLRSDDGFDIGANFYVADNTPYIRYFLSSFLQHQLFERLCKVAVFGRRDVTDPLPPSIPLVRCDIYGSKAAGKVLKDLMSRGHFQHWSEILAATIGDSDISSESLQRYYRPLSELLERMVKKNIIPIGW